MCDCISEMLAQARQDQVLQGEMDAIYDFAKGLPQFTKETLLHERNGNLEIVVPTMGKIGDMTAKFLSFGEVGSARLKLEYHTEASLIQSKISCLGAALLAAGAQKAESKVSELGRFFTKLAKEGQLSDKESASCCHVLTYFATFQPWTKISLAKLLGKDGASPLEENLSKVIDLAKSMQAAFSSILAMAKESDDASACELLLIGEPVRNIYSKLIPGSCVHKGLVAFWPEFAGGLASIVDLVDATVTRWVAKTCSTFGCFIKNLLDKNASLEKVLVKDIVGHVQPDVEQGEADMKDAKAKEISLHSIYLAYVQHGQEGKMMNFELPSVGCQTR